MHRTARNPWSYVIFLPALLAAASALAAGPVPAIADDPCAPVALFTPAVEPAAADALAPATGPGEIGATPAADSTKCCDPALEPGTNGNPFCFEGHTCCASGQWQCNNPDGTPSCSGGQVCGSSCSPSGGSCTTNAQCCSGTCKPSHKCR